MAHAIDELAENLQHKVIGLLQKLADGNLNLIPRDAQDEVRSTFNKLENNLNSLKSFNLFGFGCLGDSLKSAYFWW